VKVRVLVRLRPGIMDVQGAAVQRALVGLGFGDLRDLRVGKVIELDVDAPSPTAAHGRVDAMCKQLLANPVLEDYTIETIEAPIAATRAVR
jgi:phosphoribosylformylglycinamidine synthase PurS subunit